MSIKYIKDSGGSEENRTPVRKSFPCCIYVCSLLSLKFAKNTKQRHYVSFASLN